MNVSQLRTQHNELHCNVKWTNSPSHLPTSNHILPHRNMSTPNPTKKKFQSTSFLHNKRHFNCRGTPSKTPLHNPMTWRYFALVVCVASMELLKPTSRHASEWMSVNWQFNRINSITTWSGQTAPFFTPIQKASKAAITLRRWGSQTSRAPSPDSPWPRNLPL